MTTVERVKRMLSLKEFLALPKDKRSFSKERVLEMAKDPLNAGKPLTIVTDEFVFIISPESIAEYLAPSFPEPRLAKAEITRPEPPAAKAKKGHAKPRPKIGVLRIPGVPTAKERADAKKGKK